MIPSPHIKRARNISVGLILLNLHRAIGINIKTIIDTNEKKNYLVVVIILILLKVNNCITNPRYFYYTTVLI